MLLILVAIVAIAAIFYFLHQRKKAREQAAAAWASVEGEITASSVVETHDRDADGATSRVFTPHVAYTYPVNGAETTGSRVDFSGHRYDFAKKAQAICERYPVGSKVTVYYDPAKPTDCVLDRGQAKG